MVSNALSIHPHAKNAVVSEIHKNSNKLSI